MANGANNPGFHRTKSECVPLTRELAKKFHEMEASPTERPLNDARVKHLKKKAEQGLLIPFMWSVAKFEGREIRMNGNHSSTVLCDLNGAFPENAVVHMDTYDVDSANGLALLFRQFDDRKSGRSPLDVSNAYQQLQPDLRGLKPEIGKLGVEGMNWFYQNIEALPIKNGDDKYTLFNETRSHPFLLWLGEVFTIKTPEMKKEGVVAAMFNSFNLNATEARNFWDQVARGGVQFEDQAPATVLDNWLKSVKEEKRKKGTEETIRAAHFYEGCGFGWNAFRQGKSIKDIKYDTEHGFHKFLG